MKFLLGELTGKRPLMPQTLQTNAEQADVLNTFRTIAQLPGDSLGAYVISMARSASDVLAVVLLQVCIPPLPTPLGHPFPDPTPFDSPSHPPSQNPEAPPLPLFAGLLTTFMHWLISHCICC